MDGSEHEHVFLGVLPSPHNFLPTQLPPHTTSSPHGFLPILSPSKASSSICSIQGTKIQFLPKRKGEGLLYTQSPLKIQKQI